MLIESTTYDPASTLRDLDGNHVFRYCAFEGFAELEQRGVVEIDAVFLTCTFTTLDLYGTLFNSVIAANCTFTDCVFRGVSFATCRFVDCTFIRCTFTEDNLAAPCDFANTSWYGCVQRESTGLDTAHVPLGV
jgi:uncharacterized protein YjbI with pentapeptide repeats